MRRCFLAWCIVFLTSDLTLSFFYAFLFCLLWISKLGMEGKRTGMTCYYWAGHGTLFLGTGYLLRTYGVDTGQSVHEERVQGPAGHPERGR
jgi:hypothetical protein